MSAAVVWPVGILAVEACHAEISSLEVSAAMASLLLLTMFHVAGLVTSLVTQKEALEATMLVVLLVEDPVAMLATAVAASLVA